MGSDKALAQSSGRAMALRVADRIRPICANTTLVGDPSIYSNLGLPVVPDRFPGQGPLAGIEAALNTSISELNLLIACDMPAIHDAVLEDLFATLSSDESADCILPRHHDGHLEPLCAVYRRRCHSVILAALEAGVRKVTDALQLPANPLAIRYLRVSDPAPFANLNTPEDWRRYHHE